ncbi:HNH endonuclease signature motif containing protein [Yaniella halotolerans]|uniref:HNH endonuclease signature motif containing protein n=1 Tax=Yaniella halotolerans TaxID=225453 RepID=UPI0003B3FDCF|nr:HNH endonuclease signature motif containing protein [Yaniella halotolerans]
MAQTLVPPDISSAVLLDAINGDAVDDMSLGELALAKAFFGQKFSERFASPHAVNELATFDKAPGDDWSGYSSASKQKQHATDERPAPVPPENVEDTLQTIAVMISQHERSTEADMANLARKLEVAQKDPSAYLGTPEGIQAFKAPKDFFRQTMKMSSGKADKILSRAQFVTHGSDVSPTLPGDAPKMPKMATAFAQGLVPSENLDRFISMDQDLTKYAIESGHTPAYKDEIVRSVEPMLVEAATSSTPEEISQSKHRLIEMIAHHIDADGPPPSEVLRKKPDNALRLKSHQDGSTTASMHMDPSWGAFLKEFLNTNLNFKGDTPLLPDNIDNLYKAAADAKADQADHENSDSNAEDEQQPTEAEEIVAEDATGNTYSAEEISTMDLLSRAERAGAILLGALYSVMSMSPKDATAKSAHGSPAKLVIVQDIQTAYATLGLPGLPEAVRRPHGPGGILPTVIKRPNPDKHETQVFVEHTGSDDIYTGHVSPVPWTPYQSEGVNVGPIHPKNAAQALCDTELTGQIWNGQDIVLHEYRTKRMFTTAQRKAIFARDKGCQAPGCTIQATYCQCHHCKEWCNQGLTNEHNGITVCSRHHADIHNGKWRIRKINGITYFQPAAWVDPYQPLLRNLYWNG